MRNDLNQVSGSIPSNLYRKRKVKDTDILVDKSNFEEFERSLLSKLWKDVDDQNKVVWKVSILSYKIIITYSDMWFELWFFEVKWLFHVIFFYGCTYVENAPFSVLIVRRHHRGRIQ